MNENTHKVVILGAGFGGLSAAIQLGKLKKNHPDTNIEITVIDKNDFQLFTPDLYEIASASKAITDEEALKKTVCINVHAGLNQQGVQYTQATVQSVNPAAQEVTTTAGVIEYDYLIVALGSEPFYFGIPGMAENAIPFKWIQDAVTIRNSVMKLMEEKDQVHVMVCGAGPAGVELAAELRTMCERVMSRQCFALTLVEGKNTVLPPFSPRVQTAAMARLKQLGIQLKGNFVIARAENGKIISKDGQELVGDLIVWTGGVKASSMLAQTGLTLTKRGQVAVATTLQSHEFPNVFVIGDSAECQVGEGVYAPMTAHEAVHQGPVAAANIFHLINNQELEGYKIKDEGFVIALGGKNGIVVLPGGKHILTGIVGWFVRKYVDFRHFRTVLPFMQACSVWFQGLKIMSKNDE